MKLVLVEWWDSSFLHGWVTLGEATYHTASKITSTGIMICNDADKVNIVQSISDKCNAGEILSIPKNNVVRMRKLSVK